MTRIRDRVRWDRFRRGSDATAEQRDIDADPIEFDIEQYEAALRGLVPEGSWQPTTRRAALRAKDLVDEVDLTPLRLRAAGFGARGDEVVGRLILGQKGDEDYGYLTFGTPVQAGESAEALAQRVATKVTTGAVLTDASVDREELTPLSTD